MAFSIRRREEKRTKEDVGLLDTGLLQELQDHFCDANNLYLACLSKKHGVITKAYGSREELQYIHSKVDMDMHVQLLNHILNSNIESVVEMNCNQNITRMCGVAVRVHGEIVAIWIVIGIMEGAEGVPEYMQCTTLDRFYKSIEFLETLSKQLFTVKREEQLAQEAFMVSRASESKMEAQLRRNEVMTSVVKMLESEEEFTRIVGDILSNVSEYMQVSNASLLREVGSVGDSVDMICEYAKYSDDAVEDSFKNVGKRLLPFFNGKPYMISSNSMMPEEFHAFFDRYKLKAGVFLPIEISGKSSMYLCFWEKNRERIWDVSDIKFLNDVKRIIQSILSKRIAKNSLASSYASLEAILENVGCGIYVKDPISDNVIYNNQKFEDSFKELLDKYGIDQYIDTTFEEESGYQEVFFKDEQKWFEFVCNRIKWVDGRNIELCAIFDITEKKNYQSKAEKQANYDSLTGVYNRIRCEKDLEKHIRTTVEGGTEGAFLFLDLDDFKHINDGLGHHYGDILLQNIAKQLQNIPSIADNCYRVGGDEFAVIVDSNHYPMLYKVLEDIKALFAKPWMLKGTEYYCTMSMSVVRFPSEGDSFEALIKKADAALSDAKEAGKNRIIFYDENVTTDSYKRLDMEKHMRNAIRNHIEEFEVYYQPVTDVSTEENRCVGAEALVRWNSSEIGFVSPGDFIPLAEYLGLIIPIGEHILREACKRCKYWNDMGQPDYTVNVNLSMIQLQQPDIVDVIRNAIMDTGIIPEHLHLEVTEGLAASDMNRMKKVLAQIKKLGVKIALDDFGTGYSSLSYIREMPLDIIKIDRSFINDLAKDDFSKAFVRMIVELASTIGVITCVEGAEELAQVELLRGLNVQLIQGYYFGKPTPAKEFEEKYL